jgi:hypothetical protein
MSKLWKLCTAGWEWEDGQPFAFLNCREIFMRTTKLNTHTLFHTTSCWSVFCRVCIIEFFLQSSEKSKLWKHCNAGWKWEDGEPLLKKIAQKFSQRLKTPHLYFVVLHDNW